MEPYRNPSALMRVPSSCSSPAILRHSSSSWRRRVAFNSRALWTCVQNTATSAIPLATSFFLVVLNYCPAAHHRSSSPSAVATGAGFIRDHGDTSRRRGSRRIGGMRVRYMSGSTRKEASIGTGDSGKTVDALHALCSGLCA